MPVQYDICGYRLDKSRKHDVARSRELIEDMRERIAKGEGFGITIQGNRLTLRWGGGAKYEMRAVMLSVASYVGEDDEPYSLDRKLV